MSQIACIDCHSDHVLKNGVLPSGGQRYRCGDCDGHFSVGGKRSTYTPEFKQMVVEAYLHSGLAARYVAAQYHISTSTLVLRAKEHKVHCEKCEVSHG